LTEESLDRLRSVIESRATRGIPRDTHGDLRLDHVYLLPERLLPNKLVIVDCIEFNERFHFADNGFAEIQSRAKVFGECKRGDDETSSQFLARLRNWLDRDLPTTKS
jgi:hypothetical protein